MITSGIYNYENILDKAADAANLRNELLTNNIANVSTPNYKRKDLPFSLPCSDSFPLQVLPAEPTQNPNLSAWNRASVYVCIDDHNDFKPALCDPGEQESVCDRAWCGSQ